VVDAFHKEHPHKPRVGRSQGQRRG
jgi:hypothetical protein